MRQDDHSRPSMLSVPARWRELYFNAFSILCIVGEIFLIWHEVSRRDEDADYLDIIMSIVLNSGPVALSAAIFAFMILKGRDTMLSTWETFAKKRYEKGREEGREEERKAQAKRIAELEKRNAELEESLTERE